MRGQLLVGGFYTEMAEVDVIDIHKEALAMATLERTNTLALFGHIVGVAGAPIKSDDRQKLVRLLEEVFIIGLKEKREYLNKQENQELLKIARSIFKVQGAGGRYVGTWEEKKPKPPTKKA